MTADRATEIILRDYDLRRHDESDPKVARLARGRALLFVDHCRLEDVPPTEEELAAYMARFGTQWRPKATAGTTA